MHHNYQTHSYPAEKPLPRLFRIDARTRRRAEQVGGEPRSATSAQRRMAKRQHARRSRQWRRRLTRQAEE